MLILIGKTKYRKKFSYHRTRNINSPHHFFSNDYNWCEKLTFYEINYITYVEKKIEDRFKNKLDKNFLIYNHRKKFPIEY